jgi:MerR family mercuric resistance operon transcriptional regulator
MKGTHGKGGVLKRSDLARLTGCNIETIRYYETIGIMPEPPRTPKNYRSYDAGHVARLRFVLRARDLGFTLDEIRDLLALVDRKAGSCADVQAIALRHIAAVRSKIADLTRIEAVLSETVAQCTGEALPDCAVIEALGAPA